MSSSNILSLQIKIDEVLRASNLNKMQFNSLTNIDFTRFPMYYFVGICVYVIIGFLSALIFPNQLSVVIVIILISLAIVPRYIVENKIMPNFDRIKPKSQHLRKLYREVVNFNSLIEGVDALDQAERSGGVKRLENKNKLIDALTVMRADLICALRIEKTFRENPNFNSSSFSINLEPLKFLQISESANEYGKLFNEALQIAMSVQEEMQLLQRK